MISAHSSPLGKLGTRDTGGMSVYIRELARQLGRRGHRVDIFTRGSSGLASGGVLAICPGVQLVAFRLGPAAQIPKSALPPYLNGFFLQMDRFRHRQGTVYDLIHSHYWLSGRVGQKAGREWALPHLTTFHTLGAAKNSACGVQAEPQNRITAERDLAGDASRLLVTSARERENLVRYCDAAPEQIEVVPCGVDLDLFHPKPRASSRKRIGAGTNGTLLLYVGRFAPEKGLARLIQALAKPMPIRDLRLIVVGGDGPRDPAWQRMVELSRACGVADRVEFRGRVEQAELPWYYSAADLLSVPSSYESFGMAALEALACGVPVASTRVGAMEELLQDPQNGRLAQDFSPEAMARAIADIVLDSPGTPLKREAIRNSVRRYGWPQIAQEMLTVYRAVQAAAGGRKTPGPHGRTVPHAGAAAACCGCGLAHHA
jgi:D-inositol-3-phosphate glycosyltransferase